MTVLPLYRVPRRLVRKLLKPCALWLNAWRYKQSEDELDFLQAQHRGVLEMMTREHRKQVKLMQQRREVEGW